MSGTAGGGALRLRVQGLAWFPSPSPSRSVCRGTWRVEPNPGLGQTGVSETPPGLGTFGLLRAARGTSYSGRLCELPLGPPAHRAAILLTCCLHFVLGLLPSRASHPLPCCLPSGGVGEARAASRVAAGPLSGLAPLGPSHPPLTCGWSGARRSAVGIFRERPSGCRAT